LRPVIENSNDKLNKIRFSWMDNQEKLDDFTKRVNKVKRSLVGISSKNPLYSASGTMTFY
jgi:hypothetical protein